MLQHRSASSSRLSVKVNRITEHTPTRLNRDNRRPANIAFSVPLRSNTKYGNINPFPIDYAFRPRLRGRLTLPRLTLDRNPWSSGERAFHRFIVTYVSIRTSDTSSNPHRPPSQAYRTLPYPTNVSLSQLDFNERFDVASLRQSSTPQVVLGDTFAATSVHGLAPLHLPRRPTRPVSYYAFFK